MKIIGAGMAGLLAANILRKHNPTIIEANGCLPDNHKALLRHKTDLISKSTSIEFKEVLVKKQVNYKGNFYKEPSLTMVNEYSKKVIGEYSARSISSMQDEKRFISPENFIDQLAVGCNIEFGKKITDMRDLGNGIIISTMPIMSLCKILNLKSELEKFNFTYKTIATLRIKINNCNLYQTIYYPNIGIEPYRISITGDIAIYETDSTGHDVNFLKRDFITRLANDFGIYIDREPSLKDVDYSEMKFGKINNLKNQDELKKLIGKITNDYGIYSLGRFATWRNILLDDVVKDVLVIKKLIENKGYYTGK